ncbi:hypothetical protein V5094_12095 [Moellerella wisconsensis]|uniref:hypothetical protein n=1 Tax=Moellerella wisconsensis TaxID=158849 RepID=UPI003076115F
MSLAIIILLIILVPTIPFFCLLKKRKWKFWLDESSLHLQPLFWFLVFIPLIISGITWALVSQDYELDISTNGYSRLMENAKFPFLILTLSPILGAFVTSAHRSFQTAKQIEATEKKNKVDIYYVKRKYIHEQLSKIKTSNKENIESPILLVINSFISPTEYIDNINEGFLNKIKELVYEYNISDFFIEAISKLDFHIINNSNFMIELKLIGIDEWLYSIKKTFNFKISSSSILMEKYHEIKNKIENIRKEGQVNSKDIDDYDPPEWCIHIHETRTEFLKFYIYQLEDIYLTVNAITSILWSEVENNSNFTEFQLKLNELIEDIRENKYEYIDRWKPS